MLTHMYTLIENKQLKRQTQYFKFYSPEVENVMYWSNIKYIPLFFIFLSEVAAFPR